MPRHLEEVCATPKKGNSNSIGASIGHLAAKIDKGGLPKPPEAGYGDATLPLATGYAELHRFRKPAKGSSSDDGGTSAETLLSGMLQRAYRAALSLPGRHSEHEEKLIARISWLVACLEIRREVATDFAIIDVAVTDLTDRW